SRSAVAEAATTASVKGVVGPDVDGVAVTSVARKNSISCKSEHEIAAGRLSSSKPELSMPEPVETFAVTHCCHKVDKCIPLRYQIKGAACIGSSLGRCYAQVDTGDVIVISGAWVFCRR